MARRPEPAKSWEERLRPLPALAVPLALCVVAYAVALRGALQFDDGHTIVENDALLAPWALLASAPRRLLAGDRVLVELTFALDRALGGLDPLPYHLTSLALHLVTVALAFALARRVLTRAGHASPRAVALAAAGVFALHPLQTQAVTYVSQRAEVMASLFYLAGLLLLLRAEERGRTRAGVVAWLGATAALVLGLGSKLVVLTLPAAYVLVGAAFPRPEERGGRLAAAGRRLAVVAPWVAMGAVAAVRFARTLAGRVDAGLDIPGLPPGRYLLTELSALLVHLRLVAWPAGQSVDHAYALYEPSQAVLTAVCGAILAALLAAAAALAFGRGLLEPPRPRGGRADATRRVVGFGVLWFFLLLSPTSTLLPVRDPLVEHRSYLALLGPALAVAALGAEALRRWAPGRARLALAATAALWLALAGATAARNRVWRTRLELWSDAAAKAPRSSRAHANLGLALASGYRMEDAVAELKRALALSGDGLVHPPQILRDLGTGLIQLSRYRDAAVALERARQLAPADGVTLAKLAIAHVGMGQNGRAVELARAAVAATPGGDAEFALALALVRSSQAQEGLAHAEQAAALAPADGRPLRLLAVTRAQLGDRAGACRSYDQYVQVERDPGALASARTWAASVPCP
jgi:tetratricopeptide (TPR) repeat protein